jgi:NTP pyrophosphatase (non-canonical NTP hydrolase)
MDALKLYRESIEVFGLESQIDKAIEEAAELIQALAKYKNERTQSNIENIQDELADVDITTSQMRMAFGEMSVREKKSIKLTYLQRKIIDRQFEIKRGGASHAQNVTNKTPA